MPIASFIIGDICAILSKQALLMKLGQLRSMGKCGQSGPTCKFGGFKILKYSKFLLHR